MSPRLSTRGQEASTQRLLTAQFLKTFIHDEQKKTTLFSAVFMHSSFYKLFIYAPKNINI